MIEKLEEINEWISTCRIHLCNERNLDAAYVLGCCQQRLEDILTDYKIDGDNE